VRASFDAGACHAVQFMQLRHVACIVWGPFVHRRGWFRYRSDGDTRRQCADAGGETTARECAKSRSTCRAHRVTDNLTQLFVPEETRDGLIIERRVPFSYPDRSPRHILNARVGVSSFAEERRGCCRSCYKSPKLLVRDLLRIFAIGLAGGIIGAGRLSKLLECVAQCVAE